MFKIVDTIDTSDQVGANLGVSVRYVRGIQIKDGDEEPWQNHLQENNCLLINLLVIAFSHKINKVQLLVYTLNNMIEILFEKFNILF